LFYFFKTRESRNIHISNLLTNEILKPVKLEMTSIAPNNNTTIVNTNSTTITNNNENNLSLFDVNLDKKTHTVAQSPQSQPLNNIQANAQISQLAPLDIDLSYFEKKLESNSSNSSSSSSSLSSKTDHSSSNSKSNVNHKTHVNNLANKEISNQAKKEPNAKLYLDKLLQDIFLNKSNSGNNNNLININNDVTLVKSNSASTFNPQLTTKSDVFSDKKCNFKK
jgi:hypothetical protein